MSTTYQSPVINLIRSREREAEVILSRLYSVGHVTVKKPFGTLKAVIDTNKKIVVLEHYNGSGTLVSRDMIVMDDVENVKKAIAGFLAHGDIKRLLTGEQQNH